MTIDIILKCIEDERRKQDAKWGEQNHDSNVWITILTEEVGEAAKESLNMTFEHVSGIDYVNELIQVAAVAVAAIESYHRNGK